MWVSGKGKLKSKYPGAGMNWESSRNSERAWHTINRRRGAQDEVRKAVKGRRAEALKPPSWRLCFAIKCSGNSLMDLEAGGHDQSREWFIAAVLHLWHVSEPPRRLWGQTTGPHSQRFWVSRLGWGPRVCLSSKLLGATVSTVSLP